MPGGLRLKGRQQELLRRGDQDLTAARSEERSGHRCESGQADEEEDQRRGLGHQPDLPDIALNLKAGIVVVVVAAPEEVVDAQRPSTLSFVSAPVQALSSSASTSLAS